MPRCWQQVCPPMLVLDKGRIASKYTIKSMAADASRHIDHQDRSRTRCEVFRAETWTKVNQVGVDELLQ